MEVRAVTKHVRISSPKTRLVADMIRGKKVNEALILLKFTPKKGARVLTKTLRSAMSNAENSHTMDMETLFIKTIFVDQGARLKRWRPRAMGRATKILKPSSHITIILAEK